MGHIITDLKEKFNKGNIAIQLIFINEGGFITFILINIIFQLFNRSAVGRFE